MINLNNYKSTQYSIRYNTRVSNIITDVNEYNDILSFCSANLPCDDNLLTKHGWIKSNGAIIKDRWGWDNTTASTNTYCFIIIKRGRIYQFTFWPGRDSASAEEKNITGLAALNMFRIHCGDIAAPYALTDNADIAAVKETIEKPLIELTPIGNLMRDCELKNVKHLDIHSAYPAALCRAHPEFYFYFHHLYENRHEYPENKAYLNYCVGAMQSLKLKGRRYPVLARDAVNGTRKYILELTERMRKAGFSILGYNTDGIFYTDPENRLYHDENEGTDMGQWSTDHCFDRIRFKSAGAYEYIENGEYHPVVRGIPKTLSKTFVWGDIYKYHPKAYVRTNTKILEVALDEEKNSNCED